MILEPKRIMIAYRCPSCFDTVKSVVGAMNLSGAMFKLKCPCGGSELTIKNVENEKMRLTVPCVFCPHPHSHLVSRQMIMSRDLFTIPCSYAGIDICFFGTQEEVERAIDESDAEIGELADDEQLQGLRDLNENDRNGGDEHIGDLVTFVLGDMIEENDVTCNCGNDGEYEIYRDVGSVTLKCKKCGCEKTFFCDNSPATTTLLDAEKIDIR